MRGRGQVDMRGRRTKLLRCGCCVAFSKKHEGEKDWKKHRPKYIAEALPPSLHPHPNTYNNMLMSKAKQMFGVE